MSDDDEKDELFPPGSECHGLFLPENEKDRLVSAEMIGKISVKRILPWEENALQTFTPSELRTPADIGERWGGGVFQVLARRPDGTILPGTSRRLTFKGTPYPFAPGAREAEAATATAAAAPAAPASADPTVALMLASLERMAKDADSARKESTAILSKALETLATRAAAPPIVTSSAPAGEEKSKDHFIEGMKYAFDQTSEWRAERKKNGDGDGEGEGDDAKTIATIVEGIKAARDISKEP